MKESLIQSRQNPKVKFLAGLRKKRDREQHGCFLIEGRKELENFLAAGRILDELFHCPEFDKKDKGKFWETAKESSEQYYEFSAHAFEKVSKTQMVGLGWQRTGSHQLTTFSCQKIPYCLFWKVLKSQVISEQSFAQQTHMGWMQYSAMNPE